MSDVKKRIMARLETMADAACDVVEQSLKAVRRGQQQQSCDAWQVIKLCLDRPAEEAADELKIPDTLTAEELADKRQQLRLLTHGR